MNEMGIYAEKIGTLVIPLKAVLNSVARLYLLCILIYK